MKSVLHDIRPHTQQSRKAILVGVRLPGSSNSPAGISLEELRGLAATAFYDPVSILSQRLVSVGPKTFLGRGKLDELQRLIRFHSADLVIFDESLSPAQNRNLEAILKCRVIDRPWLILEIFNDHAKTREAKTQVELAQLKYALPRLTRMWGHLSRQRGGIGLRDVGETQIQIDRRLIRQRIYKLDQKLKQLEQERCTQRKSRKGMFKIALVGYTNSGKSTLMNILGCLDVPTSGHFYFDGQNISQLNDSGLARIRNRMIGFVFQTYNLLPRLTALQNVELPLIYGNVRNRKKLAAESLDRVGLADRSDHLPTELSGGQQQRVGIARALATEPSVLLADEPTGNLDSHSTREIIKIIQELNISQNLTVILVTHEPEIARLANRSINIVDGAIVEDRINN